MNNNVNKGTVVDVRTPAEYKQQHFPGAINIPVDEVFQRLNEFRKMEAPIVAYCHSGARSGVAVSLLKQNGLSEVYNAGGLSDILQQLK
jgi:phage shock protein E